MAQSSDIQEINTLLEKKEFDLARQKCDEALKTHEGLNSVAFLLARSTALRALDLPNDALSDCKTAVSVDPEDPQCYKQLVSCHESIIKQSQLEIIKAKKTYHSKVKQKEIERARIASAAPPSKSDPITLPKVCFDRIFFLADENILVKSRRVSKRWLTQLDSTTELWRDLEVKIDEIEGPNIEGLKKLMFFSRKSNHSLRQVLVYLEKASWDSVYKLFKILAKSKETLQGLHLKGFVTEKSATREFLMLASKCKNLKFMNHLLEELEDDDEDYEEEEIEVYGSPQRKRYKEEPTIINLDEIDFKCHLLSIVLTLTEYSFFNLGIKMDLFRSAKWIKLDFQKREDSEGENLSPHLSRETILKLLRMVNGSLHGLQIFQDFSPLSKEDGNGVRIHQSNVNPQIETLNLPNLYWFAIMGEVLEEMSKIETHQMIVIIAPKTHPDRFVVSDDSFVLGMQDRISDQVYLFRPLQEA